MAKLKLHISNVNKVCRTEVINVSIRVNIVVLFGGKITTTRNIINVVEVIATQSVDSYSLKKN